MLTETVDGVCLPGMMSADLAITRQGRGCVAGALRGALLQVRRALAGNGRRGTRRGVGNTGLLDSRQPPSTRCPCVGATRGGRSCTPAHTGGGYRARPQPICSAQPRGLLDSAPLTSEVPGPVRGRQAEGQARKEAACTCDPFEASSFCWSL